MLKGDIKDGRTLTARIIPSLRDFASSKMGGVQDSMLPAGTYTMFGLLRTRGSTNVRVWRLVLLTTKRYPCRHRSRRIRC